MKVSIEQTVEVSDEQREQIAHTLDGDGAKKRQATRAEIKDFIWRSGEGWAAAVGGNQPVQGTFDLEDLL